MSSPATRGTGTTKRHPACPGKSKCQLQGCIHNAFTMPGNDEISINIYEINGRLGDYPSVVRFSGGLLYQRLEAASELFPNSREINNEPKETIGTMMYIAQTKVREVSDIVVDRIRSCLSYKMPM